VPPANVLFGGEEILTTVTNDRQPTTYYLFIFSCNYIPSNLTFFCDTDDVRFSALRTLATLTVTAGFDF